jgi:anti-sigma regulatory factor (Ser/Thr protein kinase)
VIHQVVVGLYCQVSDDGPVTDDQDPGREPGGGDPSWPVERGHGLWMIGQLADQFSIDHGPAGTTATACFTISPARTLSAGREARCHAVGRDLHREAAG